MSRTRRRRGKMAARASVDCVKRVKHTTSNVSGGRGCGRTEGRVGRGRGWWKVRKVIVLLLLFLLLYVCLLCEAVKAQRSMQWKVLNCWTTTKTMQCVRVLNKNNNKNRIRNFSWFDSQSLITKVKQEAVAEEGGRGWGVK